MVHLEHEGQSISLLLDIVEVAKSHTGVNLATAFAKILEDYNIYDKVNFIRQGKLMGCHCHVLFRAQTHPIMTPSNSAHLRHYSEALCHYSVPLHKYFTKSFCTYTP
jgi:hypothetical protein